MKASLSWISDLLPTLEVDADEIAKRFTAAGLEVEAVERPGEAIATVVTAEVRTCDKHPDADKLSVCTVFDGESEHHVVCGAPNVAAGQTVAFAPVGTTLPNGLTLEKRKIRGQPSEGMICAEDELGLGDDHDGIMVLPEGTALGQPVAEVLGLDDTVLEIGVTPNRPDVLSHHGLARELSALTAAEAPTPKVGLTEAGGDASTEATVEIRSDRCSKYIGRIIKGVKVGPSSPEVQRRLQAVGQRPISNVVDATNLVLMELGHPLHAFDLHRLGGHAIIVREATEGEQIELLDGSKKTLTATDLVIADADKPVALAGVMGGANSEVHDATVDILLEAAVFDPSSVRKTARRHGLHTEASHRFERGVDPAMVEAAIDRCAAEIVAMGGGEVLAGRITVTNGEATQNVVPIRAARAAMLIGRPVDAAEVDDTLRKLGFEAAEAPAGAEARYAEAAWYRAPSWRVDIAREEDLIEEVGRLAGYDGLEAIMPPSGTDVWATAPKRDAEEDVRDLMVGLGFYEAISLAFSATKDAEAMGISEGVVRVANPLGEESALMRVSMLPPLLEAARLNQDNLPSVTDVRLFEIGRTFSWANPPGEIPEQGRRLGVLMRGRRYPRSWSSDASLLDAFDLKGVLDALLERFGIRAAVEVHEAPWLHPRSASRLVVDGAVIGHFGEAHPNLMERYQLEGAPVFVAELDLEVLAAAPQAPAAFQAITRHPPSQRDLSFFLAKSVTAAQVVAAIEGAGHGGLLEEVEIFDVYEGKGVADDERSVAVSMTFRAAGRTLKDAEVEAAQQAIVGALEGLGARIRAK